MKKGTIIALITAFFGSDVFAADFLSDKFIQDQLNEFHKIPAVFMQSPAPKSKTGTLFFDHETVITNDFVNAKIATRKKFITTKQATSRKSSFSPNDRVEALVDTKKIIHSLTEMEKL